MKTPKLTRSKTSHDGPSSAKSARSYDSPESTFRTSFDDLRRPENRQMLRQHLTGQFPESQPRASDELLQDFDTTERQFLSRSQSSGLVTQLITTSTITNKSPSSSPSGNSTAGGINKQRLSTVREMAGTIDIEQAISLLQELKKTASPDQLVALHKALLPTRDSTISLGSNLPVNGDHSANTSAPPIRHRSLQPAGLATRGGPAADLLKKQNEPNRPPPSAKSVVRDEWGDTKPSPPSSTSKRSLAALDLADEQTNPALLRAATPSDCEYANIGTYGRGTLRVTNGAASPDPSIARPSVDVNRSEMRTLDEAIMETERGASPKVEERAEEYFPARESFDETPAAPERLDLSPAVAEEQAKQPALPQVQQRGEAPVADEPQPTFADHPEPRTAIAFPITYRLSRNTQATLNSTPQWVPRRIDARNLQPLPTPDMPRFAQRLSHRAQHISEEYIIDCVATPFDEAKGEKGRRDEQTGTREDDTGRETPTEALRKLNGDSQGPAKARSLEKTMPAMSAKMVGVGPWPAVPASQPVKPQNNDSGYNSEASLKEKSRVARMVQQINETGASSQSTYQQGAAEDVQSLYTVNDVLKMPSLLDGMIKTNEVSSATPISSPTEKKSRPLISLSSAKKCSPASCGLGTPDGSPAGGADASSPVDAKKHRKLQKQMPASLRKKKKAEMRALQDEQLNKFADYPAVPDDVAVSFARRPESMIVDSSVPVPKMSRETSQDDIHPPTTEILTSHINDSTLNLTALPAIRPLPTRRATDKDDESTRRSFNALRRKSSTSGKRSKSVPRTTTSASLPKSKSVDLRQYTCGTTAERICSGERSRSGSSSSKDDDFIPPFTDIGTTARALGCSPYDVSTNQFRRRVAVPGAVQHVLQSPHQIGTTWARSKYGGLVGMEDATAAELARLKSRDLAIQNCEVVFDRPRTVTPRGPRGARPKSVSATAAAAATADEMAAARGSGGVASEVGSVRSRVLGLERPQSMYAESIPSLPEIPAKFQKRADAVVRAHGVEARASAPPARIGVNDLADPIAEVIRKAVSERKAEEARQRAEVRRAEVQEAREVPLKRVHAPTVSLSGVASMRDAAPTPESILIGVDPMDMFQSSSASPSTAATAKHLRQHSSPTGWEEQAALWRERRRSIGRSLGQEVAVDDEEEEEEEKEEEEKEEEEKEEEEKEEEGNVVVDGETELARSPTIIVTHYIPPFKPAAESSASPSKQPPDAATVHAETYAALIGATDPNGENRPAKDDVDRTDSANTFITARSSNEQYELPSLTAAAQAQQQQQQHYQRDLPPLSTVSRSSSPVRGSIDARARPAMPSRAHSYDRDLPPVPAHSSSTLYAPNPRDRSPGGRAITPAGNFFPYRPAIALAATNDAPHHPHTSSKLPRPSTAVPSSSIPNLHSNPPKSTPSSSTPDTTSPPSKYDNPATRSTLANIDSSLMDRYSGGLLFGFEKRRGVFGGSAGMKAGGGCSSRRESREGDDEDGEEDVWLRSARSSEGAGPGMAAAAATAMMGLDLSDVPVFLRRVS